MNAIRAIRWNIEESGTKREHGLETRVHWRRTYLYFKNVSDTLVLDDSDDNYESDVEKLKQAWEVLTQE